MAKLESSWNVHHSAREPHSVIRVSSLHVDLPAVRDAWGRYPKSQPALITCAVSLHQPFTSASAKDAVTSSTIHYGNLSKAIIEACHRFSDICPISPMPLSLLLHYIQSWLTGVNSMDDKKFELLAIPLIEPMGVELLTLEIFLPKASLLGSGVKMEEAFRYNRGKIAIESYSVMLEICCLKIPVIIGVNQNEKLAKQVVVVSIQIDFYDTTFGEDFYELEQIIVKTIEESSFQTLEALGNLVGQRIHECFLIPQISETKGISALPTVRLKLSKPTAVTLADAPMVEMLFKPRKELSENK